jgi:hypothetical protein
MKFNRVTVGELIWRKKFLYGEKLHIGLGPEKEVFILYGAKTDSKLGESFELKRDLHVCV